VTATAIETTTAEKQRLEVGRANLPTGRLAGAEPCFIQAGQGRCNGRETTLGKHAQARPKFEIIVTANSIGFVADGLRRRPWPFAEQGHYLLEMLIAEIGRPALHRVFASRSSVNCRERGGSRTYVGCSRFAVTNPIHDHLLAAADGDRGSPAAAGHGPLRRADFNPHEEA
jgi:hypothetical protein